MYKRCKLHSMESAGCHETSCVDCHFHSCPLRAMPMDGDTNGVVAATYAPIGKPRHLHELRGVRGAQLSQATRGSLGGRKNLTSRRARPCKGILPAFWTWTRFWGGKQSVQVQWTTTLVEGESKKPHWRSLDTVPTSLSVAFAEFRHWRKIGRMLTLFVIVKNDGLFDKCFFLRRKANESCISRYGKMKGIYLFCLCHLHAQAII